MLISLSLVPLDDGPRSTGYFDSAQHKSGTGILVFGVGGRGQPHHSVWREAVLRLAQHELYWKLDELPELWDVLIGNMSFVGPRPDVPGYADKLEGEDRDVLKLRPGITGPATLKARANERRATSWLDCYPECSRDSTKSNIVWRTR